MSSGETVALSTAGYVESLSLPNARIGVCLSEASNTCIIGLVELVGLLRENK